LPDDAEKRKFATNIQFQIFWSFNWILSLNEEVTDDIETAQGLNKFDGPEKECERTSTKNLFRESP